MPRSPEFHNWNHLYESYFSKQNSAAYYFTHVFFKTELSDDPIYCLNSTIKSLNSQVLLKTKRAKRMSENGERQKMIVKIDWVESVGIHVVWDFTGNRGEPAISVPVSIALLHHYRFCSHPEDSNFVRDTYK